jgi:hypothetical protein
MSFIWNLEYLILAPELRKISQRKAGSSSLRSLYLLSLLFGWLGPWKPGGPVCVDVRVRERYRESVCKCLCMCLRVRSAIRV